MDGTFGHVDMVAYSTFILKALELMWACGLIMLFKNEIKRERERERERGRGRKNISHKLCVGMCHG